ncbi:hypothetical protein S40285_10823 [Stachybotrys chlorohalonatus IBT 40285]|uniref:Uncharacterized protein n=1 Tax=Stachybotrys chlorohalonatus (strain IBT 40285) TaxID=1283841 RepID=A0A084QXQ8_STAC4|nr:hypothetical protein S40285_10823 [Stachybotrys chlorohalonata IBT 40285]
MAEQDPTAPKAVGLPGCNVSSPAVQTVEWWMIIDKKNKLQLHPLELLSLDTGTTVMSKLKAKYELTKQCQRWWNSAPVIEEVTVSPYCVGDAEVQDYPREVLIESSKPHPVLTKAFQRPGVLRSTARFLALNSAFAVGHGADRAGGPHNAIYVKVGAHLPILYVAFAIVLLVAVVAGILVGFLSGTAAIGLATTSTVVGLFGVVNAFLFWASSPNIPNISQRNPTIFIVFISIHHTSPISKFSDARQLRRAVFGTSAWQTR